MRERFEISDSPLLSSKWENLRHLVNAALLYTVGVGCGAGVQQSQEQLIHTKSEAVYSQCAKELEESRKTGAQYKASELARQQKVDVNNLPSRVEFTNIDGDPKVGTVIHFRQWHPDTISDKPLPKGTRDTVLSVQGAILEDLIRLKPSAILSEAYQVNDLADEKAFFAEGGRANKAPGKKGQRGKYYRVIPPEEQPDLGLITNVVAKVAERGVKGLDKEEQRRLNVFLYMVGSEMMYFSSYPETVMVSAGQFQRVERTSELIRKQIELDEKKKDMEKQGFQSLSEEKAKQVEEWRRELGKLGGQIETLHAEREQEVLEQVMWYLGDNPGDNIAVVYGAAHNFCDEFSKLEKPPVFKSVYYPKLVTPNEKELVEMMQPCKSERKPK